MRYIKEYATYDLFSNDEVSDIKDLYNDLLVDELNLNNVSNYALNRSMDSFFEFKYDKKGIVIHIRTIGIVAIFGVNIETNQNRENFNKVRKELGVFITRLKSMGYYTKPDGYNSGYEIRLTNPRDTTYYGFKIHIHK